MSSFKFEFPFFRHLSDTGKTLAENEMRMNTIFMFVLISFDFGLIMHCFLHVHTPFFLVISVLPIVFISAAILMNILLRKKPRRYIKYINFAAALFGILVPCMEQDMLSLLLFIFPPFISIFYFNPRFSIITSAVSWSLLQIVLFNSISLQGGEINHLSFDDVFDLLVSMFNFSMITRLPSWEYRIMALMIIGFVLTVGVFLSFNGRRFYQKQAELISKNASTQMELNMAQGIQKGILAGSFPDTECYGVFADMTPAAEVGGDFYDWFPVDETHLAIVIGDVSGHGMPAAMFMALTKTLIKVYAQSKYSPDKVLERTNRYLLQSNPEKFFVTGWIGVLDLTTGILTYANAGHHYPVILRKDADPELLEATPGFVLGRKRLVHYFENRVSLSPGDKLLLYTDGVTEAKSPDGAFFENERLMAVLKTANDADHKQLVQTVRKRLDAFENGGEHYDDATMLALSFKKHYTPSAPDSRVFTLNKETFNDVIRYIVERCEEAGCNEMAVNQITVASSEILANIDSYAYENGGSVEILSKCLDRRMMISFVDSGKAFNPLSVIEPDTALKLSERRPGGLGIFIVKKLMTDVSYEYSGGHNKFTIEKEF